MYRTHPCTRRTHVQDASMCKTHTKTNYTFGVFRYYQHNENAYPCTRHTPTFDAQFWGKKMRLVHGWIRFHTPRPHRPSAPSSLHLPSRPTPLSLHQRVPRSGPADKGDIVLGEENSICLTRSMSKLSMFCEVGRKSEVWTMWPGFLSSTSPSSQQVARTPHHTHAQSKFC